VSPGSCFAAYVPAVRRSAAALGLGAAVVLGGCQSAYYGTMERLGYHKRDILAARVEDARDAQEQTKEQFRSALERFSQLVSYKGGELSERYEALAEELEKSEERADRVRDRITAVEDVGEALFDEWRAELELYTNRDLRRASATKLDETRQRYDRLVAAMRRAEKRIEPVLGALRDQVLYLKHNLNARAVGALRGELETVESDVAALLRDMQRAIDESDAFLSTLGTV